MYSCEIGTLAVDDIIRNIEETVERANLLALELALKSLENSELVDEYSLEIDGMSQLADRAAHATGEIERLVRRLKAA
jgi:methyl-accepting chemotaxis protein